MAVQFFSHQKLSCNEMWTSLPLNYCDNFHASRAINPDQWPKICDCPARFMAILLYGSWNVRLAYKEKLRLRNLTASSAPPNWVYLVHSALVERDRVAPPGTDRIAAASLQVDEDDESYDICINRLGCPPDMPSLAFLALPSSTTSDGNDSPEIRVEHVHFNGSALDTLLASTCDDNDEDFVSSIADAWSRLVDADGNMLPAQPKVSRNISGNNSTQNHHQRKSEPAIRIFIAGDRSQVGKSSICLGLLGALLKSDKYTPTDLAYIKPATQCEQTQLVEEYCKHKGITACVPVGPIVYYKGFTRAFLKGETGESSQQLLQKATDAVDKLALNKKVVIIDGVGYPAVGSITGTDNASVAKVCGRSYSLPNSTDSKNDLRSPVPVLLVGKSGVGDAVDSFNINATYFVHKNVPVIGAIFNKLSLDGFYSLSNCKEAIDMYFSQSQPDRTAFGYIPEIPSLKNAREHVANNASKEDQLKQALDMADLFVEEFAKRVNVDRIMLAAKDATAKYITEQTTSVSGTKRPAREIESGLDIANSSAKYARTAAPAKYKSNNSAGFSLTREQIEALASASGAAGG